jgi:hypothetical protein
VTDDVLAKCSPDLGAQAPVGLGGPSDQLVSQGLLYGSRDDHLLRYSHGQDLYHGQYIRPECLDSGL